MSQYVLSTCQKWLWVLEQEDSPNVVRNFSVVVQLEGMINTMTLEKSLYEIVSCHESLRTVFGLLDEESVQ